MHLLTPAKINLHLRVGPPRSDGFHPLLTWMVTVGFFDTLVIEQSHDGQIRLSCDAPGVPCDASNLVVKTAAALADWLAMREPRRDAPRGLAMRLQKNIPAGAGLGGGSSNGAFALAGLNALWQCGLSREELAEFAARFGSDLSFFFFHPSALCRGRGELVTPLPAPAPKWAVVVLPDVHMPTPAVYRILDEMHLGRDSNLVPEPAVSEWTELGASELLELLRNDLEPAAFSLVPALGQIRAELERKLARPVRMSGSGSSLFTLYDDHGTAESAAAVVSQEMNLKGLVAEIAPKWNDDLSAPIIPPCGECRRERMEPIAPAP